MSEKSDGMNYAPRARCEPVVEPGEFVFAAMYLDHGHILGMCQCLIDAGAELRWVWDPDPRKLATFREQFPQVRTARSEAEVLGDDGVALVAAAAVPRDRCALGLRVMEAGKDYFTDKSPMTTLDQLAAARAAVERTRRKYMVYYSERLTVEASLFAGQLIEQGAVGRVLQVINLAPHRLNAPSRPEWFWSKQATGGILTDIGSHQVEQYLEFSGAKTVQVASARAANLANPEHPEFEDFGEATLVGDDGSSQYFRVDWFTPDGLRAWGDGRLFVLGTEGYIEVRKYVDVAAGGEGEHVILVDGRGERRFDVAGEVGFPYFGRLIRDCLERTETAMTQERAFLAAELSMQAQQLADAARR
jgi:predicted dehydrogenase